MPASSSHTSSSSSSGQGPFKSYPNKYPRARQRAQQTALHLQRLVQQAPRSQVAVVVDASFHVSQGYVLCTTQHAVVRVYGVPYGSVVAGMRLFVRTLGSLKTNQGFVFDGYAPNLSGMGTQGSLLVSTTIPSGTAVCSSGGLAATTSAASLASAVGYYWHLFFYLPVLPTQTVTLFHFVQYTGGSNAVSLEYLPSGRVQFRSQDNHGYITNAPVAPHNAHWVVIQPGNTGAEFLVDTVANYSGLLASNDEPSFTGGGQLYTLAYLTTVTGTQGAPLGSWVSKMGYGTNFTASVVALPNAIPVYDSQVLIQNLSLSQTTENLYLCEDTPGGTTLTNTGLYGSSGTLTVKSAYAQVQTPGPY